MGLGQGGPQIVEKALIVSGQGRAAGDQNIVMTRLPIKGKKRLRRSPQPPLGAVADYRTADFAGGGEAHADGGGRCLRIWPGGGADFEGDGVADLADAFLGAQEIGAFFQAIQWDNGALRAAQADSFLRPWVRRRLMILRPAGVAMRARKPWRRARTILLG